MKVVNQCRVNFRYVMPSSGVEVYNTVFSNEVSTEIVHHMLSLRKYVDRKDACTFDILIYNIVIENISNITVTNLFFVDNLTEGVGFIRNSVRINGIKKRCVNVEEGFNLGDLQAKGNFQVEFKALVLPYVFGHYIKNHAEIEYDYVYNIEKPPYTICRQSNEVITKCNKGIFKQITVNHSVNLCDYIEHISYADYKVKIIKTEVINNPIKNSSTLLVLGKIEYRIWYKTECCKKPLKGVFGFSQALLVPRGINYAHIKSMKVDIEDMSFQLIGDHTIFINSNLLLYF